VYDLVNDMLKESDKFFKEFRFIKNRDMCEDITSYSPYCMKVPEKLETEVLIFNSDKIYPIKESYKLAARLRESMREDAIIIKDLTDVPEYNKYAYCLSFLIHVLTKSS